MHQTNQTTPNEQPQERVLSTHRPGDGWHKLSAMEITPKGKKHLTSEPCVLLLLHDWALQRGYDAAEIVEKAYPEDGMFRADGIEHYRMWTHIPECIDTEELALDLEDINYHSVAELVREIDEGKWTPGKAYTHWVVAESGGIAGEARELDPADHPDEQGQHFCYVRLFAMPDCAEYGYTNATSLRPKRRAADSPVS